MVFIVFSFQGNAQVRFRKKSSDLCTELFLRVFCRSKDSTHRPFQPVRMACAMAHLVNHGFCKAFLILEHPSQRQHDLILRQGIIRPILSSLDDGTFAGINDLIDHLVQRRFFFLPVRRNILWKVFHLFPVEYPKIHDLWTVKLDNFSYDISVFIPCLSLFLEDPFFTNGSMLPGLDTVTLVKQLLRCSPSGIPVSLLRHNRHQLHSVAAAVPDLRQRILRPHCFPVPF